MASNVEGDASSSSAATEALKIPLILQQIFKNLNTKLLLSSCRLVNQIWSREATTFIQNCRQFKVRQPDDSRLCEFLRDFDDWLGQMTRSGRKIPFNALKIRYSLQGQECSVIRPEFEFPWPNFKEHFNLKYLDSSAGGWDDDCPYHHPFAILVRHCGEKLQNLAIENPRLLTRLWKQNQHQLSLPQLRVLNLSNMDTSSEEIPAATKEAVQKLLNAAPNLQNIVASLVGQLRFIPKENLSTLSLELPHSLVFEMQNNEDIDYLHVMSVNGSTDTKHLAIYVPAFDGVYEVNERPEDELINPELRMSFNQACQQLLQNCHSSLKTISIHGVFPLADLHFNPLMNVTKLKLTKVYEFELEELWNSIASIDFERSMPGLEEVEVCVHRWKCHVLLRLEDPDWEGAWPPGGHTAQNNSSSTVKKLTLELQFSKINFAPLRILFPNVSILHLNLPWAIGIAPRSIPLAQICKYFPQLAELKMGGCHPCEKPSLDADFCGISEKEVNWTSLIVGSELGRYDYNSDSEFRLLILSSESEFRVAKLIVGIGIKACDAKEHHFWGLRPEQ